MFDGNIINNIVCVSTNMLHVLFVKFIINHFSEEWLLFNTAHYYSTIASFYHIWSRERAKYETVIHCSVPV